MDTAQTQNVPVEALEEAEDQTKKPPSTQRAGVGSSNDGKLPKGSLGNVPEHKQRP